MTPTKETPMVTANQPSATPTTKISAAAAAGAITAVVVWIIGETTSVEVPPAVVAAITVLVTVLAGYMIPEKVT